MQHKLMTDHRALQMNSTRVNKELGEILYLEKKYNLNIMFFQLQVSYFKAHRFMPAERVEIIKKHYLNSCLVVNTPREFRREIPR